MRIALIAPLVAPIREPNLGGAQAVVVDHARGLTRRGHEVVVYAGRGSVLADVELAALDVDSAPLAADMARIGVERAASPALVDAYERVYTDVAGGRFDVVHNHGFDVPAVAVAARRGLAVLHTLHLPPSITLAGAIEQARAMTPTWCAAVSEAHGRAWARLLAVDAVLRNGVPTAAIRFSPGPGAGAVIAARFSPEKGIDSGIAAVRSAGLRVDVYATPYDQDCERSLRERWGDDRGVRFLAPVPRDQLWAALGRAAVTVCLVRWDEPFGMVAAESLAAGTPVVATARGGLPEVVADQVTGRLVDGDDEPAAGAAVSGALQLDRAACRAHAEQHLDLETTLSAHEQLYSRIAG